MPFRIHEWFGYKLTNLTQEANKARATGYCTFIDADCDKTLSDRTLSGVCSVTVGKDVDDNPPVVICPNRVYAQSYALLSNVPNSRSEVVTD